MTMQTKIDHYVDNKKMILCYLDKQEVEFDHQFELWINRKIDYSELMKKFPDYEMAMPSKVIKWISRMLSQIK